MRQGQNGRRGPRRPHPGGSSNPNGGEQRSSSSNGGHSSTPRGEVPRRSAASLRTQNFDSNGPDVRVRGNAWQVHEKYQSLARDAQLSGDRVAAENFQQHAEHYYRIIEAIDEAAAAEQAARGYSTPQPDTRNAYPAPVTEGAQGEPQAAAQTNADGNTIVQPEPVAAEATVEKTGNSNPFFTPEEAEAEAETEAQQARVASF